MVGAVVDGDAEWAQEGFALADLTVERSTGPPSPCCHTKSLQSLRQAQRAFS